MLSLCRTSFEDNSRTSSRPITITQSTYRIEIGLIELFAIINIFFNNIINYT